MRSTRAFPLVGALILSGCGLQADLADRAAPRAALSEPAPPLSGSTLTGSRLDIATLRGHPVVVDFWASWCGPCRAEQPEINSLYARYASRGVHFVGVDLRDDQASALAFVRDFGVPYPSIFDPSSSTTAAYRIDAPPTTVLVDGSGTMRVRDLGTLVDIRPELDALLGGSSTRDPRDR